MDKAFVVINKTGKIQSVNHTTLALFGYKTTDELVGHNVNILMPQPYKHQHDTYIKNYQSSKKARVIGSSRLVEAIHKDQSIFPIRLTVTEIKVEDDVFYCGLIQDLSTDSAALVTCNESRIIQATNTTCEQLFGYSASEYIGQNISIFGCPQREMTDGEDTFRYVFSGEPSVIGKARNLRAMKKDGTIFQVCLELSQRTEGGQKLYVGKINEITEDVETMIIIDTQGIIQSSTTKGAWLLFGYTKEELIGNNINMLMSHPHKAAHGNYIKRYLQTGEAKILGKGPRIVRARHKDGSVFHIYLEITKFTKDNTLFFSGRVTRVLRKTQTSDILDTTCFSNYIGNYIFKKTLADGIYGKVKVAKHVLTGEKVVIKLIEKSKLDMSRFREAEIMKKLIHKNIARLLEVVESPERVFMVYDFISGGELYDFMTARETISEDVARTIWRDLINALEYMHDNKIVHRDLKLENIMMNENDEVIVIDFGLGNFIPCDKYNLLGTFCGSTAYAPPEMFLGLKYRGTCADIWSACVTLYCLVTGYLPYEDPHRIVQADYIPLEKKDGYSLEFIDLISKLFKKVPAQRLTIEEIKVHPWTTNNGKEPMLKYGGPDKIGITEIATEEEIKQMEEYGFMRDLVEASLNTNEFNQINATLFLLRKKNKKQEMKQKQKQKEEKVSNLFDGLHL